MTTGYFHKELITKPVGAFHFVIISYSNENVYHAVKNDLEKQFAKIAFESRTLPHWQLTQEEILSFHKPGEFTRILGYSRRINREELPGIKKKCSVLKEENFKKDSTLRIIPGYLTSHNVIIASAYDDFHRVYLFHGIYAEIIYKFEKSELNPLGTAPKFFTFPDVIYFFTILREYYVKSLQVK